MSQEENREGNKAQFTGDYRETLYTVDRRGNRKWVYATFVDGFFRRWRTRATIVLMAFYLLMPWIKIHGEQGILLNIVERKFVIFGSVFIATDMIYLFLLLAIAALTLFFVTSIVGRIWCGWACPETVFLEFLFRPIERWIEGDHLARRKLDQGPWNFEKVRKKALKHAISAFLAWIIASTFLAYFVGSESLLAFMFRPPWEHPFAFGVLLFVMGAMGFQFGWFREQFCTIVCPYGRFQSVLLDPESVVIGYDFKRGEPRGKLGSKEGLGDCIDCGNCVKVCPTGIDIRNGLQMECINCTACLDACDAVMTKVKKPLGLIRYASQTQLLGGVQKILRPRVVIYATLISVLVGVFVYRLGTREMSEFHITRGALDAPYHVVGGKLSNHLHLHLTNKGRAAESYKVELVDATLPIGLIVPLNPFPVEANHTATIPVFFEFDLGLLERGRRKISVRVSTAAGYTRELEITLLGPGI